MPGGAASWLIASVPATVDPRLWIGLVAALVVLAFVQTARLARLRSAPGRALRLRADHAALGERRAEAILEALGFTVVGRQVVAMSCVSVDGAPVAFEVRADLVVARGARTFVAEVKTGAVAPRIESPATRRQLLEYHVAFEADGVLLVDADRGTVREVAFPLLRRESASPSRPSSSTGRAIAWAFAIALAGVALALAAR